MAGSHGWGGVVAVKLRLLIQSNGAGGVELGGFRTRGISVYPRVKVATSW